MKSASNGGVLKGILQVLHIHILFVAPLGACHMVQPYTDQHQGRVTIRETAHHTGAAANLPVQPLNDVVGADTGPMFAGEIAVGQSLLNAIFYLFCSLFQLHSAQFLHHSFGLLPGCFLALLGVDRFEHLGHNLYLGARRYRLRSYRAAWVSFSASASSSSLSVSSTLSRTNSFSCPFITSSFSCTIFMVCCLLLEWSVTTSFYQSSASHVSFSFCETYSTLSL